jgi:hypothetical protein
MPSQISNESFWIIIAMLVAIEACLLALCFSCGKAKGFHQGWDAHRRNKMSDALRDD